MFYVYSLQSETFPDQFYIGITNDLKRRLDEHNQGKSAHTLTYAPWKLLVYVAFTDKNKALAFEKYLKTGSGREFAKRHF